ncbi:MAG: hypothetical protein ACOX3G_06860 [Armatimonadota bacterium]|jgi:hypothetical protein
MIRQIIVVIMAGTLMLVFAAASFAAPAAVEKLLPANGDVAGFKIMDKSLIYGKGTDVTKIYNGGYELYTKNGVIDAVKQMYQRDSQYVEVAIHTMKSAKAATDFVNYWARQRESKAAPIAKLGTGFTVTKPNVMSYYAMGKYFVTVAAYYPADKAAKDTEAFARAVKKRIKP